MAQAIGSQTIVQIAPGGTLSPFQEQIFNTDVHDVFLNTSEWAQTVTYTVQATGSSKQIIAEWHQDPSGEMNELRCQYDISRDPVKGVPDPAHGDTLTDPEGEVWRVLRFDDLQFGMVALACRKLKE